MSKASIIFLVSILFVRGKLDTSVALSSPRKYNTYIYVYLKLIPTVTHLPLSCGEGQERGEELQGKKM